METDEDNHMVTLHEMSGCLVTKRADGMVFKRGRRIHHDERPALELAAQYGLPVPRVYDSGEIDGEIFIQMDFIEGERLDRIWPRLTAEEKSSICQQLRGILTIMRSIPHESGLIGSCSGGKARDDRQYTDYSGGPFTDEATFNSSFYFDLVRTTPIPIRTALYQQTRSDHRIVFSHCDLSQHNIMVKDGQITGLLDWENAGWYPEHWEYIKFFDRPCEHNDWMDNAKDIFPEIYDNELAHHQAIVRWQRP
ncbi:kinase-like domain-containing protein [Phaeosphaeria sp. MPI-PUGE-AT-0046c]|nr:kinase-like domain-containing protein [Phaeosphaeria sp. MPI-PUGE-AT-0046c]